MKETAPEILYGRQPVREALRAGRRDFFFLKVRDSVKSTRDLDEIYDAAKEKNLHVTQSPENWFRKVLGNVNHQGVALGVSRYPYVSLDSLLDIFEQSKTDPFCLILDHLEDPQNVGSILRTCDAMGVQGVIIPKDRATGITPTVVRVSAGASEHIRISLVTNVVRSMKTLQQAGLWLAGLDRSPSSSLLMKQDLTGPLGLVVGSEGKGIGRLVRDTCDYLVELPSGQVSSLNAAVAAAMGLYEVQRQRGLEG